MSHAISIGSFGTLYFDDCMNVMSKLSDHSFDLCLTDLPWGSEYDKREKRDDKEHYDDTFDPIKMMKWLKECLRIAKTVIFIIGTKNLFWWIQETHPVDIFYFVFPYTKTPSTISRVTQVSPALVWGVRKQWLDTNAIKDVVVANPIHPAAKSTIGWKEIVRCIKPKSVIDPFCGSGVTAECCEELGIYYTCIELNAIFHPIILTRTKNGQKKRENNQKSTLDGFC